MAGGLADRMAGALELLADGAESVPVLREAVRRPGLGEPGFAIRDEAAANARLEYAQCDSRQIVRVETRPGHEPAAHAALDPVRLVARDRDRDARSFAGERLQHGVAAI